MSIKSKLIDIKNSCLSELRKKEYGLLRLKESIELLADQVKRELTAQNSCIEAEKYKIQKEKSKLVNQEKELEQKRFKSEKEIEAKKIKCEKEIELMREKAEDSIDEHLDDVIDYFEELKNLGESPKIVDAYIDACFVLDEKLACYLEEKGHPSFKLADEIRNEYKKKNKRLKELEYLVSESWAEDEDILEEDFEDPDKDDEERVKTFLSDIEYRNLSESERNQLALDRYLNKPHNKSHIGKMYERYIGYIYEKDGYEVEYRGIEKGLKDGGIDLVCRKKGETKLIQCKCWNQESTIYEKHICQLYGASIFYDKCNEKKIFVNGKYTNVVWPAIPIFVTTTQLDEQASIVANKLGIKVRNISLSKDYPMIKGNINSDGDKIYHLPFDQMYDHTKIIPSKGEQWFLTVKQAENAGFRRAKRHFFINGN